MKRIVKSGFGLAGEGRGARQGNKVGQVLSVNSGGSLRDRNLAQAKFPKAYLFKLKQIKSQRSTDKTSS
jgi:hypothetical protein